MLHLYNSSSQKKEKFIPINENEVKLYVCGPTVYDLIHIGNGRSVVVYDLLYRILMGVYGSDCVKYVRNITDVDDKINARAKELNVSIGELTKAMTAQFHQDATFLYCLPPTIEPKAIEHIAQMIAIINKLIDKNYAYVTNLGNVYFRVKKYRDYGNLAHRDGQDLLENVRISALEDKEDNCDFALWKAGSENDHESSIFSSPWSLGRPGWHIECSAMSHAYLGENFDIHGGGVDLLFPHHSNEIAQSKCAFDNSSYAHYWVHNGTLTVNKNKMSKSLGNFITVDALRNDNISGEALRWFLLSANYHKPLDYSAKAIDDCQSCIDYLYRTMRLNGQNSLAILNWQDLPEDFTAPLLDNMNSPKALSFLLELAKKINKASNEHKVLDADIVILKSCANFLGLLNHNADVNFDRIADVTHHPEIDALIQERIIAKKANNWHKADEIRDLLTVKGVILEDSKDGSTSWRFKVAKTDKS